MNEETSQLRGLNIQIEKLESEINKLIEKTNFKVKQLKKELKVLTHKRGKFNRYTQKCIKKYVDNFVFNNPKAFLNISKISEHIEDFEENEFAKWSDDKTGINHYKQWKFTYLCNPNFCDVCRQNLKHKPVELEDLSDSEDDSNIKRNKHTFVLEKITNSKEVLWYGIDMDLRLEDFEGNIHYNETDNTITHILSFLIFYHNC